MRKLLYIFMLLVAVSCGSEGIDPGAVAAEAAKQYYDYLLKGEYEQWVDGHYRPDSITQTYHEQLVTNAQMYVGLMKKEHEGIVALDVVKANADTARHEAQVFLNVTFGDSTKEEILVPMVERGGIWYLK